MKFVCLLAFLPSCLVALPVYAQNGPVPAARVAVLQIEQRRAPTPRDLTTLRTAVRGRDQTTALLAIRAIGRLERPALIPDIVPGLRFALPESRAEAANAIAQAAQGWKNGAAVTAVLSPATVLTTLVGRLAIEEEPTVRAALGEAIARLPYRSVDDAARAEGALLELAGRAETVTDRLGVAKAFEAFVRLHRQLRPISDRALEVVAQLASRASSNISQLAIDPLRDARVRRLALEALIAAERFDDELIERATADPDPQVRRLAMRAAAIGRSESDTLARGINDSAAIVRYEALRGLYSTATAKVAPSQLGDDSPLCAASIAATGDEDLHVTLLALDQLAACGGSNEALSLLERLVRQDAGPTFTSGVTPDLPASAKATARPPELASEPDASAGGKVAPTSWELPPTGSARGWHRSAHALVALAKAAPDRTAGALERFGQSNVWQLRAYAARAASVVGNREVLETLALDSHDNVVEIALDGLTKVAGHNGDAVYMKALTRSGYQAIRAAAIALEDTPNRDTAVPALTAAWKRLIDENRANSSDTRAALQSALARLGAAPPLPKPPKAAPASDTVLNAEDLQRLAAPSARVRIRDIGTFELALFTTEAPATVLEFTALAESGYYNGLTFHRVVPNFVIQGGSPAENEYVGTADHMPDEVGMWPHVRGTVGISTRGRDTGDGQIFIGLVDNPKLDHEYTVFAQVLNGIEVVDRIAEGDVIESIEIVP
jgi:cyclophilin family peptidyl-prolyl cis-trans isomerase